MVVLNILSGKLCVKKHFENFYVCIVTTVLYEHMNLLRNYVYNLFFNTHVRIKIYQEFYHSIIYRANEGRHVRIILWKKQQHETHLLSKKIKIKIKRLIFLHYSLKDCISCSPNHFLCFSLSYIFCVLVCHTFFVFWFVIHFYNILEQ